ncbi:lipopolysaccharide assembly protein LapB [Leptolyngbya sp. FACHB-261]|uniref:tetratricopeptide repeat protein n=1 Tax=Leptolyngbya sp. FACHB-261 TaxID=2692806 RepID=UPI001681DB51|nr:tetratricopeptide repeat protein [Leptolyngbya sp. FACHB-261]MBD2101700.1 tetratricopeptide repeat protein [Leptolyngbya sp. FACHB-261]
MPQRRRTRLGLSLLTLILSSQLGLSPAALAQASLPIEVRQGYDQIQRGLVLQAITTLEQAVRRYPNSAAAQLGLAIAYRRQGLDEKALNAYERVVQLDPTNETALRGVGLLGAYRPAWQQRGIRALSALLERLPNDQSARRQRANLYRFSRNWAQAAADYAILLRSNPDVTLLVEAAQAYNWGGGYPQALELFERAQELGQVPRGDAALAYGNSLGRSGRLPEATEVLVTLIRQEPVNSPRAENAVALLTGLYADRNDQEGLLRLYAQLLERSPDNANLNLAYAATAYSLNRITPAQAEQVLDTWLTRAPQSNELPAALYTLVAQLPPDLAREDLYQALIRRNPNDGRIAERYAQALVAQGPQQAQVRVEALANNTPSVTTYLLVGRVSQALGNYDRAAAAYDSILVQNSRNLDALLGWAQSEAARRNFELARQLYSEAQGILAQSSNPDPGRQIQIDRGLTAVLRGDGQPQAALSQLEQLQNQTALSPDQQADIQREMQDIEQGFLLQRGFQPPWERY